MEPNTKWKVAAGAVAALAVAGAGGAVAATKLGSANEESQAVINDAANQLGVSPTKLNDALKKALENRIDAAVAAGRLTKEQGAEIKKRIESGDFPLFGGPPGGPEFRHLGDGLPGLDTAASYLGLTESQLESKLESGKTLAEIAKDQGKSVDGLVQALVADAKKHLDQAVEDGHLTKEREQAVLKEIEQRITDAVNGKARGFAGPPAFGGRPDFGGPPGFGFRGPPGSQDRAERPDMFGSAPA